MRLAEIDKERASAENNGLRIAVSHPCYELWTLLHLQDTGEQFDNCAAVIDRLKQRWKERFNEEFDKSRADYSKIIDQRNDAAARARQHHLKQPRDQSWTEIYLVIEHIESLPPNNKSGA